MVLIVVVLIRQVAGGGTVVTGIEIDPHATLDPPAHSNDRLVGELGVAHEQTARTAVDESEADARADIGCQRRAGKKS